MKKLSTNQILAICFLIVGLISLFNGQYLLMLVRFVVTIVFRISDQQKPHIKR
ncbi:MAG: hypothetical protein WC875_05525 [Candidatus Absconditabacterales bacterium]